MFVELRVTRVYRRNSVQDQERDYGRWGIGILRLDWFRCVLFLQLLKLTFSERPAIVVRSHCSRLFELGHHSSDAVVLFHWDRHAGLLKQKIFRLGNTHLTILGPPSPDTSTHLHNLPAQSCSLFPLRLSSNCTSRQGLLRITAALGEPARRHISYRIPAWSALLSGTTTLYDSMLTHA